MKILLTHDGSVCSDRAVKFVTGTLNKQVKDLRLTLVHVDVPMLDRVAAGLGEEAVARIHRENTDFALRGARARLKAARIAFEECPLIGNVAGRIVALAEKGKFDVVVMGSHGRTALKNLLLGSVTTQVMAQSKVPVVVVR